MPSICVSVRPDHQSVRQQITCAIEHLKSLHDGECGFTEVVGLVPGSAIPSLRLFAFRTRAKWASPRQTARGGGSCCL